LPEAERHWEKKGIQTEQFFEYFKELSDTSIRNIEFCAVGDPLYHPDIWKMIEAVKLQGIYLRISTNGTLITSPRARDMMAWGVDELSMNISAGDRDTYADIHNVSPKIFDNLRRNLSYLAQLRAKAGVIYTNMIHIHVLTEKNARTLQALADFAYETGANYMSYRFVWSHKSFLQQLDLSTDTIRYLLRELPRYGVLFDAHKIGHNIDLFIPELHELLRQRGEPIDVEVNREPAQFTVQAAADNLEGVPLIARVAPETLVQTNIEPSWRVTNLRPSLKDVLKKIDRVEAQPQLSVERAQPPCVVTYHFTLLGSDHQLRYCCHGDKVHEPYVSIKQQWASKHYQNFRTHWQQRFRAQEGTCLGCPHLEENRFHHERLMRYGVAAYV
jgi:pyruvate-formate lyase-activating enzyme